ncbi:MAG: hypothetical protein LLG06_11680 [Desulfobacteraceae bacterium]|nr:hypothetical protein [Desulfobacteraceae bacterium]
MARIKMEAGIAGVRECSRCHTEYPLTEEYFHKDPKGFAGLASICKTCRRAIEVQRRALAKASAPTAIAMSLKSAEASVAEMAVEGLLVPIHGTSYPDVLVALRRKAEFEIRTPVEQAIWELREALCGGDA